MRHRITSVGVGALLSLGLITAPAGAHGALESPLSRAAACGADSPLKTRPAACRAAVAAGGKTATAEWDNLRVANVAGRDRETIPDGKLCSGGIPEFKGLDLARADWPATTLKPGARFTFRYRGTIPHQGTFRLYVTKKGYDPTRPLKWSDLERKPFLQATDPKLTDGSYVIKGRLPSGRTGRHLIYTIWQNSDTPDTYYSCSDVVFRNTAPAAAAAAGAGAQPGPATEYRLTGYTSLPWLVTAAALFAIGAGAMIILLARPRRHR
ncbi:lytic polysaccharide monooxygenase [Nonomuraea angiospora]|uniref:Chitin-binding protein n=1 Tax=Nonomuraea angiospora TaxID=46172 RepID=A0ABR9M6G7_9ACTN|nr:lytic polysaccharide monooxygenase [Nonomuraea angiospora]MBE1588434.1 chitin-binding protein [Nonomuraea angiospora]